MHPMLRILYLMEAGLVHLRVKLPVNIEFILIEILRFFTINELNRLLPFFRIVLSESKLTQTLVSFVRQNLQVHFPFVTVLAFLLRNLGLYEGSHVWVNSPCIYLLVYLPKR